MSARDELLHEEAKGAPPLPAPAGLRVVMPCGGGGGRDGRRESPAAGIWGRLPVAPRGRLQEHIRNRY